ncbi:MAG: apolipoprotein N-acyltransferase [Gammaproteobacteria bacterium]|nr:apolipoprotein N-acyltransferase [Gammaproteobacteria bacterium]
MKNKTTKLIVFGIIAILAGIQIPLALAPFNIEPLAFIAPAILLTLWLYATPKQAFFYGLLFGLGCFTFGASWVFISIHTYGNASILLASILTGLLIIVLALFPALQGYILTKLFPRNSALKLLVIFPLSWLIFDLLRSWVLTGFPWLFLGYSQLNTPLSALAPILSVYGVTFAVVFSSAFIITPLVIKKRLKLICSLIVLVIIWLGSGFLAGINWTQPKGSLVNVTLIQGNIPQELKWQADNINNTLLAYKAATEKNWQSKLIIWPEAAIPVFNTQAQPFINLMANEAKQHQSTIISGIPISNPLTQKYYNGMIAFGENHSIYLKRHLVPFGEYTPFKTITKFITDMFNIPMSSFSAGPKEQPIFIAGNIKIAPFLCYEIAFPTESLAFLPEAELLVTLSDDSWFGKSIAAAQQLQMSQMRSLETDRYQLVGTNTGITAIINNKGKIIAHAPEFKKYILHGKIQPMTGATPWVKFAKLLHL